MKIKINFLERTCTLNLHFCFCRVNISDANLRSNYTNKYLLSFSKIKMWHELNL